MTEAVAWRGIAGNAHESVANPLTSLSQPLVVARDDDVPTVTDWSSLGDLGTIDQGYLDLLRTKRVFAIGGLQLVIDCGLVPDWYSNDANRRDALNLIEARKLRPLFDRLTDRDLSTSIFGKNDLREFFKTFPPVRRDVAHTTLKPLTSARQVRKQHPLRLRKALEFLFLTEAVLRDRFRTDETKKRFESVTGVAVDSEDSAEAIWGYMWVEPLLYVVEPAPRAADIKRIMGPGVRRSAFAQRAGQREEVLYWALRGVPSAFPTADAAAQACNDFYGSDAAKSYAVVVAPDQHDARQKLMWEDDVDRDYVGSVENVVRLTP